jgi:hypothetical protein
MKTPPHLAAALPAQAKASVAQPRESLALAAKKDLSRPLPVFHGKGGLATGLTRLSHNALLGAADE